MSRSVPDIQPAQTDALIREATMDTKNTFTKEDAQLPSVIMALLDVCVLATENIDDVGTQDHVRRYYSSIAMTMKHTLDVFVEFHEKLDNLDRLEVTA